MPQNKISHNTYHIWEFHLKFNVEIGLILTTTILANKSMSVV